MRHRFEVIKSINAHAHTWTEDDNDYPPPNGIHTNVVTNDYDYVMSEATRSMDDVVTPNFKKLCGMGVIINNPMTSIHTQRWDKPTSVAVCTSGRVKKADSKWYDHTTRWLGTRDTSGMSATGGWTGFLPVPAYPRDDLISQATNKAWANISLNEAWILVGAAEADKTVVSLYEIFQKFLKIAKAIKKKEIKALAGEIKPKALAQDYMAARYAVRPLMYDLKGYYSALQYKAGESPPRLTFRGMEYYHDEDSAVINVNNGYYEDGERHLIIQKKTTVGVEVRAGVLCELTSHTSLPVLGVTEILESAWELVPWSFVVDWFLNVGDTIAAFTPNLGLKTLASWVTVSEIVTRVTQTWGSASTMPSSTENFVPYEHSNYVCGGEFGEYIITKERIPNPSRTILPSFDIRLNSLKLIDLLIMIRQLVRS